MPSKSEWREVALADAAARRNSLDRRLVSRGAGTARQLAHCVSPTRRNRKRFGDEAIPMIDRLAIMSPTLNLYGLRTRAGFAAERPEVVVESVSNYARLARGHGRAPASIRRTSLRKDASALRRCPRRRGQDFRAPTPRASPKCAPRSRGP